MHPVTLLLLDYERERSHEQALRDERRRALLAARDDEPAPGSLLPVMSRRPRPSFRGVLHFLGRRPAADHATG